ncbi:methyl-accepting chemotaxis protein [Paenibacillus filicis]|uniref:Methyl-accepting chemotaxis protein n=1 Tax=Paenibacillus filicis TaxID=669464 RepID=A0ABU9DYG2_9BACL
MKMTVAKKLYSGFFSVLLLLAVIAGISYYQLKAIDKSYSNLIEDRAAKVSIIKDMVLTIRQQQLMNRSYLLTGSDKYLSGLEKARTDFTAKSNEISKMLTVTKTKDLLSEINRQEARYKQLTDQAIQSKKQGDMNSVLDIIENQAGPIVEDISRLGTEFIAYQQEQLDQGSLDNSNKVESTISTLLLISVIAILAGAGIAFLISRQISRPILAVSRAAERIAAGDLTEEPLSVRNRDEIGELADSFNTMTDNLRQIIRSVLNSASSLSAAAQEISASTEEIASGSTSQAGAAQTINQLFSELSSAINSVARGAEQASELTSNTMSLAEEGSQVLQSSIDGMNVISSQMSRLEEDSNKIGDIIEVIDDIADQTNLLALNAAIEAARAGDQGRGFAVVADEVRKLAERSIDATKQITVIIKGMQQNTLHSISAVNEGVTYSQKTGEAFARIFSLVNESASKVTEIAAASEEQAAQTSEVRFSIESISASTEQAAAASEETASAAQSLALLAEELNSAVEIFKIR